jgi:hypothetical protein
MLAMTNPDIPIPAGAVEVDDWVSEGDVRFRYFVGRSWIVRRGAPSVPELDYFEVMTDGTQHADGRVERVLRLDDGRITVEEARELAAALTAAADEVEMLSRDD